MKRYGSLRMALVAALLAVSACGGPTKFLNPEADLPFYEKVGIVPFTSLAQDRAAGYRVTNVFFTELLERGFAEVVEPGQFAADMASVRGGTPAESPWSTEQLAKLGEKAGVQGIFMGTVRQYEMVNSGRDSYPLLSVEVRLVDAATGRLVWSASETRKGGAGFPIFGWGGVRVMESLTADVCRDLLTTLPRGRSS
jgi:hypothetical protein